MTDDRQLLGSPWARQALEALHDRPVNFRLEDRPSGSGRGWEVDEHCRALPPEPPGPPVEGGSWEIARRLIHDYEFADPRMVRAVYFTDAPLEERDMLLVGRFFGLRFKMGVRVGGVVDEECRFRGRPVRVWGWDYKTLRGHLEAGQMDYEVWKWLDTGAVEFRIRRFVRTGDITNPVVRLGWKVFGRWMQVRFVRRALTRMERFVAAELGTTTRGRSPRSAAGSVAAMKLDDRRPAQGL